MELTDDDHKVLTWLRALGSEPPYTHLSNQRERAFDQAARFAQIELGISAPTVRDRLFALQQEGLVEIVSRNGSGSAFHTRITEEGRQALQQSAQRSIANPIIFVSCGQTTKDEIALGKAIAQIIDEETPARAYFAENQASLEGVSSHILGNLESCIGFVAIMHYRGQVMPPGDAPFQRASVWVEQEIAIASYRIHTLNQHLQVQLYIQNGIKREGLRDKLMLNPVSFDTNEEVIEHFRSVVRQRFGSGS